MSIHVLPLASNDGSQVAAPLLVSVKDACRVLATSRAQIYRLIGSGDLESVHVGHNRRIPYDALVAYVNRLRAESETTA